MMTRRGLLGLFGSAAAAFALDPERALWVRGAKTISIASPINLDEGAMIEWSGWNAASFIVRDLSANPDVDRRLWRSEDGNQSVFALYSTEGHRLAACAFVVARDGFNPSVYGGDLTGLQRLRFDHGKLVRA